MPEPTIEIKGLEPIIRRMAAFPGKLRETMETTMWASLTVLHEEVPPYPPKPSTSSYVRTGTLGRTLGASMSGGQVGNPDIWDVKKLGADMEGHFGTALEYAPYVVGDRASQQAAHMAHWWTIPQTVLTNAKPKIKKLWAKLASTLAKFLAGKGM